MDKAKAAILVEANETELARFQTSAPGGLFRNVEGAVVGLTSVPSARYNGVLEARFPAEAVDERVRAVVSFIVARRKAFSWAVGPSTRPRRLGPHLARAGLHHLFDLRAMALDLEARLEPPSLPGGVRIERLTLARDLPLWTRTLAAAFGDPKEDGAPIAKLERALGLGGRLPRQLFLGRLNGRPVAAAMLFAEPPAAGIYNVGVLERFRGRGIGAAMMRAALAEGRARRCTVGTLYSTALGAGLYRGLGYVDVGKLEIWGNLPPAVPQG